ncbi:MAG TPA: hypothetical protein VKT72_05310 [Candidatus Baltobacteraceae bacterium]|nr:hypothetical protein [Candidatus Baltobacteraceae bacterium]
MHGRKVLTAAAFLAAATLFAACGTGGSGGGGGNPNPPGGGNPGPSPTPNYTSDSVNMVNAVGALALSDQDLETANTSPKNGPGGGTPNGQCTYSPQLNHAGYEFFDPDKQGTPGSTERIVFYDHSCTQMAMDVVRVVSNVMPTSETVTRTITRYAQPTGTQATGNQIAQRTEAINYSKVQNGFDAYGYPNTNAPLIRTSTSTFNLTPPSGKSFTVTQDDEFIAGNQTSATTLAFCADDAGINQAGNYGFATQTDPSGGTITNDASNDTTTFKMTRMGYSYPSGSLQLNLGTPNAACPISTPYYTIAGGNTPGQYVLPIQITIGAPIGYPVPPVAAMTVKNASFPNGETLNVQSTNGQNSLGQQTTAITGTFTNFAGTVSTFTMDAYGSGTLTVNSTGQTLPIQGWHVAQN